MGDQARGHRSRARVLLAGVVVLWSSVGCSTAGEQGERQTASTTETGSTVAPTDNSSSLLSCAGPFATDVPEVEQVWQVRLDGASGEPVAAFGSVWVIQRTGRGSDDVVEFDPTDGTVRSRTDVGDFPTEVVAFDGRVWVGSFNDRQITVIDPRKTRALRRIGLADEVPARLVTAAGRLWVNLVSAGSRLVVIDPDSLDVTPVPDGGEPWDLAAGSSGPIVFGPEVKGAFEGPGELRALDGSGRLNGPPVPVGDQGGILVGAERTWITRSTGIQEYSRSGEPTGRAATPGHGAKVSTTRCGMGRLWTMSNEVGLQVVDLDDGTTAPAHLGMSDFSPGYAFIDDDLWITDPDTDTVTVLRERAGGDGR